MRYVVEAENRGATFGTPFRCLPAPLVVSSKSASKLTVPAWKIAASQSNLGARDITAGQLAYVELYIGDMSGNPNPGAGIVWLYFENGTTGQITGWFPGQFPTFSQNYNGSSFANVIERPTSSATGNPIPLAEFSGLSTIFYRDGMYYPSGQWSDGALGEPFTFFTMLGNSMQYAIATNSFSACGGGDVCSPPGAIAWWGGWNGCQWSGFQ
jgi:hypothetical protein